MIQLYPPSEKIWNDKYRYLPTDPDVEGTWWRVARTLASVEKEPEVWTQRFYDAMTNFKFIPAGRILAGAGTGRTVTLPNCFVMSTIPDSLDGIFTVLKESALTMQQGGGIGMDFSTLRPKGATVKGVEADASGPLSFMDCWDSMCRTIMSAGARRGAMMGVLRCDHPDVEAFIEAKRDPTKLRMFNVSVAVTDAFMGAVDCDSSWDLKFDGRVYKTIQARELWNKITRNTYDCAEPGVIFIDVVNRQNNVWYSEEITATNPCGEIPMGPSSACLLGSVNLPTFVKDPFTPTAEMDLSAIADVVSPAVRMLDNVNDVTSYPLEIQKEQALSKRRIGLGITGLGDALIMCGTRYGSDRAVEFTDRWMAAIEQTAYQESARLAEEKGCFPLLNRSKFAESGHVRGLPTWLQDKIRASGMRNSHLMAIAPTGTISFLANYVSGGLEPVFSFRQERKVLEADGNRRKEVVEDFAYRSFKEVFNHEPEGHHWITAQDLGWRDHVKMLAAVQKHVDQSCSKTINTPADIPFYEFQEVYRVAYASGCKSCTTYRPNDVTGAVIVALDTQAATGRATRNADQNFPYACPDLDQTESPDVPYEEDDEPDPEHLIPLRPPTLPGRTYKIRWPNGVQDHAYYVTINDALDGSPFEIFINSKDVDNQAWTAALTRMISAIFRRGGVVSFVADELKCVHDPKGGTWIDGTYVPSLLSAIGGVIERHVKYGTRHQLTDDGHRVEPPKITHGTAAPCPKCASYALHREEGCERCAECGWSRCS